VGGVNGQFVTILNAVLPVFLVIGSGFVLRRLNWLTPQTDQGLLRLVINLLIPCLIFDSLLGNEALRSAENVFLPPLIGFSSVALGALAGWMVGRWIPSNHPKTRATFAFCIAIYNYGYVPIPLVMSLFDRGTLGVLFVHNLGVETAFWSFASLLLAGENLRMGFRKILNAPLVAILGTLAWNATIGPEAVPIFFRNTAHMLGQCAIPLGMLLIGATIADQLRVFQSGPKIRIATAAVLLRLGVLPLVGITAAVFLPVSVELKRVMIVQAAMPAAVFPIVLARHYHGDTGTALTVVLTTSALSFITIPLWLRLGMLLVKGL